MKTQLETDKTRNNVLFIKWLIEQGYREKVITLITKTKQPYVNKIKHGSLHAETKLEDGEILTLTREQTRRKRIADRILAKTELITVDENQDIIYLHLLKYFLVPKDELFELYNHKTKKNIAQILAKKDVDLFGFKSELLGIDYYDYLDLIVQ